MAGATPRQLVDRGAAELKRFGYEPIGGEVPDWRSMWALLKGDFAADRSPVPDFCELTAWPQEAARIYMRRRLVADRLFEECRLLYERLHAEGIGTDLVEAYTLARDAYEEAVMDFGAAREKLEEVLVKSAESRSG